MIINGVKELESKIEEVANGRSFDLNECINDLVDSRHEHMEGLNYIELELYWDLKREVINVPVTFHIENDEEYYTFY